MLYNLKVGLTRRSAYISEEFKITNIKVANYRDILENCDRWFKSKFLYWLMTKVVKNERLGIFLVQTNM
jgi:hypothetical protein